MDTDRCTDDSGHQDLGAWQSGTSCRACKRSSTTATVGEIQHAAQSFSVKRKSPR